MKISDKTNSIRLQKLLSNVFKTNSEVTSSTTQTKQAKEKTEWLKTRTNSTRTNNVTTRSKSTSLSNKPCRMRILLHATSDGVHIGEYEQTILHLYINFKTRVQGMLRSTMITSDEPLVIMTICFSLFWFQ